MTASGTCGYGTEYGELVDIQRLGAIVSKGTTLVPWDGNPQPRITETPCGVLNSIGLQNIGVDALIREKAPVWAKWRVPVIVNIAGETIEEYVQVARRLDGTPGVSALEVNIGCPNIRTGGCEFGVLPDSAATVTKKVKQATSLPVIVKLTPNTGDIVAVAVAVERAGADAISLINTLKGMAIDIECSRPLLGGVSGGLSGPAVKPVALYMVYRVAGAVDIPVIGCGGIGSSGDALEFLMAGASAVQVGTACLSNPEAPIEVLEGIEAFMKEKGIREVNQLIGSARR